MGSNQSNGFFGERARRFRVRYFLVQKKAKTFTIPGFHDVPLYYVVKFFFKGIINGAITTRASAVAFSFYLAIVPTLIFLFTLIPYIPVKDFQFQLLSLIKGIMPDYAFHTVESTLTDVLTLKSGGLLSFGFFAALFSAIMGLIL